MSELILYKNNEMVVNLVEFEVLVIDDPLACDCLAKITEAYMKIKFLVFAQLILIACLLGEPFCVASPEISLPQKATPTGDSLRSGAPAGADLLFLPIGDAVSRRLNPRVMSESQLRRLVAEVVWYAKSFESPDLAVKRDARFKAVLELTNRVVLDLVETELSKWSLARLSRYRPYSRDFMLKLNKIFGEITDLFSLTLSNYLSRTTANYADSKAKLAIIDSHVKDNEALWAATHSFDLDKVVLSRDQARAFRKVDFLQTFYIVAIPSIFALLVDNQKIKYALVVAAVVGAFLQAYFSQANGRYERLMGEVSPMFQVERPPLDLVYEPARVFSNACGALLQGPREREAPPDLI